MEATEEYRPTLGDVLRRWEREWVAISWAIHDLEGFDDPVPEWFSLFCQRLCIFVMLPIIDLLSLRCPRMIYVEILPFFVDERHADARGGFAPYGDVARRATARKLKWWLRRNLKSMMLVQK